MYEGKILMTIVIGCIILLLTASSIAQNRPDPEKFVDVANNCELNIARLDNIHTMAGQDGLIIAIARLGEGETRAILSQRRLYNLRLWLKEIRGRNTNSIVTAAGDRIRGRGRIEIYVGGKLVDVLGLGKGEDLAVGSCDGTGEIDHLYYGWRRRKR